MLPFCAVLAALLISAAPVQSLTFSATKGSPPRAGLRGAFAGPQYNNDGTAVCSLLIAQDPNPQVYIQSNSSTTLEDCTDLAAIPLSDYSFLAEQTKCLSTHTAVYLNTVSQVPGIVDDSPAFCSYAVWDAVSINLTYSVAADVNSLQCPTASVTPKTVTSTNGIAGLNVYYPLEGAQFIDCSGASSS